MIGSQQALDLVSGSGLENELHRLGVTQKNGRPGHPQTQGKVERFQQTLQKWLAAQAPAATITGLQAQLDAFTACYNTRRPHRVINAVTGELLDPNRNYQPTGRPPGPPPGTPPTRKHPEP